MPKLRHSLVIALVLLGCTKDKPIEPIESPSRNAGSFLLTLTTPNTDDAALLFELRGPGISAIHTLNPSVQLFADSSGTTIRGALFGPLTVGALVSFDVPDTTKLADYLASVLDVVGPGNGLRSSLTGYSLRVAR
jgi:hypothetical protein